MSLPPDLASFRELQRFTVNYSADCDAPLIHYLLASKSFIAKNLRNHPVDSLAPIMGTLHLYTKDNYKPIISFKGC
jgi:hypothetical protein